MYLSLVTLSIPDSEEIYVLVSKVDENGHQSLSTTTETDLSQLFSSIVGQTGSPDPDIQKQYPLAHGNILCHYHYSAPKKLFKSCLPEDYTQKAPSQRKKHFISLTSMSISTEQTEQEIFRLLQRLQPDLLPKVKETTSLGPKFGRAASWFGELAEAEDNIIAVINPGLSSPIRRAFTKKLQEANKPVVDDFDVLPGGRWLGVNNETYTVAASLGPVALAIKDNNYLQPQLVESVLSKLSNATRRPKLYDPPIISQPFINSEKSSLKLIQRTTVTRASILKIRRGKKHNNGRRLIPEQDIFDKISGNTAVKRYFSNYLETDVSYNYSHLIAYQFIGEQSQIKDNIVLATEHCNTMMMFVEDAVSSLALQENKIDLKVVATISNDTKKHLEFNVAERIVYEVTINETSTLTFEFNPQSVIRPPIELVGYIWHCMQVAMEENLSLSYDLDAPNLPETTTSFDDAQVIQENVDLSKYSRKMKYISS